MAFFSPGCSFLISPISKKNIDILFHDFIMLTFVFTQIPFHALNKDAIRRVVLQDELEVLFADFNSSTDVVEKI